MPSRVGYTSTRLSLPGAEPHVWAHPGAATGPDGTVFLGGPDGRSVIRLRDDGDPAVIPAPTTECHGLAVNRAGDVWIADNGHKRRVERGAYADSVTVGQVIRMTADGRLVQRLAAPYADWQPTGVALSRFAGVDCVLVADGYGANRVHCFSRDGGLMWSTDASDTGTAFSTPHGIAVDPRTGDPVIAVADRRNCRIVLLDGGGTTRDVVGLGVLTSPSGLAIQGDLLWVTELFGGLVAFDVGGRVAARIGDPFDRPPPGWPNGRDEHGTPVPPARSAESFVSPHGIAALPNGGLIVTEWVLGGAATILTPI